MFVSVDEVSPSSSIKKKTREPKLFQKTKQCECTYLILVQGVVMY